MGKAGNLAIGTAIIVIAVIFIGIMVQRRERSATAPPPVAVSSDTPKAAAPPATTTSTRAEEPAPEFAVRDEPATQQEPIEPRDQPAGSAYRGVPEPVSASGPVDPAKEWQRAFEKEERDEAWAAPLEAEIRKSLEPEINLGRFYLANAECRATLCEIRLQARGSLQRAELDLFQSTIYTLPWAAHLNPALSSGTDSGDGYESLWIFERRPEPGAAN